MLRPWLDRREVRPGTQYAASLAGSAVGTGALPVVSLARPAVRRGTQRAASLAGPLVVVVADDEDVGDDDVVVDVDVDVDIHVVAVPVAVNSSSAFDCSCICSLFFFFILASLLFSVLYLVSCVLFLLSSYFTLRSWLWCLLCCLLFVVSALVVLVFCVKLTKFRFTVTKVSSESDKSHSRHAGMSEMLGSLFCVVKNNGIISRHGSKIYYYRGQEPEKKRSRRMGSPMRQALESSC